MKALELPWPPAILSPNARPHWAVKARAVKEYRGWCRMLAGHQAPLFKDGEIHITITFCPPNKRKRDRDNLVSSMKSGMDGIAEAWGIDDARFVPTYRMADPVKFGCVIVEAS